MIDRRLLVSTCALLALLAAACSNGGGGRGGAGSTVAPATSGVAGTTTSSTTAPVTTAPAGPSTLFAGAAELDVTPPVGVPLAGYGGGQRRHTPLPRIGPGYDHILMPSTGVRDPIMARALSLSDGTERVTFVALDAIATDRRIVELAWQKARILGAKVELEQLMVCSSHTHSGPGCVTQLLFWELTAADFYADSVAQAYTDGIARVIFDAEKNAVPARAGVGSVDIPNATHNRRAGTSKVFTGSSVDPEALVLRVDRDSDGKPIATLWNFAIHGVSLDTDNHLFSADIMGGVNAELSRANVGVPIFFNSGEGDISPDFYGDAGIKTGGIAIADKIVVGRGKATTLPSLPIRNVSENVDFGQAHLDLTINRIAGQIGSLSSQGWFQFLQQVGGNLGYAVPIPMGWIENEFRYQGVRVGKWGFTSIPGEAIHTIALDLKARGKALGFERTFTCGLANGHMAYICTPSEYDAGGYESLATFWGRDTADKLTDACMRQLTKVKP